MVSNTNIDDGFRWLYMVKLTNKERDPYGTQKQFIYLTLFVCPYFATSNPLPSGKKAGWLVNNPHRRKYVTVVVIGTVLVSALYYCH